MLFQLKDTLDALNGRAGEFAAGVRQLFGKRLHRSWKAFESELEKLFDLGGFWKRNEYLGGLRIMAEERVQFAKAFGEKKTDNIVPYEQWVATPFSNQESQRVCVERTRRIGGE